MREMALEQLGAVPRDVVVIERRFDTGLRYPGHRHDRGQFAYARQGSISVFTRFGHWLVPPRRAVWVPAGVEHEMQMRGPVTMLNTFIDPVAAASAGLAESCQVCAVSPLLHQLLLEAVDLPTLYPLQGRCQHLMSLLLAEIVSAEVLYLHAPLPADERLAMVCRALLDHPTRQTSTDEMAERMSVSRRTFTRWFRQQTGVSFGQWQQQACLLAAMSRLAEGQSVTRVALDLGYASPAAFSALFRRVLGQTPQSFLNKAGNRECATPGTRD